MTGADLIKAIQASTGPDREIDLAVEINFRPDGPVARLWATRNDPLPPYVVRRTVELDRYGVHYANYGEHDRCQSNGTIPVPAVTASLHDAAAAMPEGWQRIDISFLPHRDDIWRVTIWNPTLAVSLEARHKLETHARLMAALGARMADIT